MKNYKISLILLASFIMYSCAVFPVKRTYFEPNPEDGRLTRSSSCGYNATAMDSLERKVNGLLIDISPFYEQGELVSVSILIQIQSGEIEVNSNNIELHSLEDMSIFKPININRNSYGPDKSHPYINNWFTLDFPIVSEKLEAIKFVFPNGCIKHDGKVINIKPFRFKKITKSDVYYGSINC